MFVQKQRYQHSRVRFFEREHGTEFLRFEMDQMRRFAAAKRARGEVELDGYVAWIRPRTLSSSPPPPRTASMWHAAQRRGFRTPT